MPNDESATHVLFQREIVHVVIVVWIADDDALQVARKMASWNSKVLVLFVQISLQYFNIIGVHFLPFHHKKSPKNILEEDIHVYGCLKIESAISYANWYETQSSLDGHELHSACLRGWCLSKGHWFIYIERRKNWCKMRNRICMFSNLIEVLIFSSQ